MKQILTAVGIDSSALVVTAEAEGNIVKSTNNLPGVKTIPASLLNVVDILSARKLLMTVSAVRTAEKLWGLSKGGDDASLRGVAAPVNN